MASIHRKNRPGATNTRAANETPQSPQQEESAHLYYHGSLLLVNQNPKRLGFWERRIFWTVSNATPHSLRELCSATYAEKNRL